MYNFDLSPLELEELEDLYEEAGDASRGSSGIMFEIFDALLNEIKMQIEIKKEEN